uniref:Uncharacterized protein n=1 Tax=Octopus bimaculoides TaxID=37653 RepID=A0A0L8FNP3_OCTBM
MMSVYVDDCVCFFHRDNIRNSLKNKYIVLVVTKIVDSGCTLKKKDDDQLLISPANSVERIDEVPTPSLFPYR